MCRFPLTLVDVVNDEEVFMQAGSDFFNVCWHATTTSDHLVCSRARIDVGVVDGMLRVYYSWICLRLSVNVPTVPLQQKKQRCERVREQLLTTATITPRSMCVLLPGSAVRLPRRLSLQMLR